MSTASGPKIVTDGLVLCLDASNYKSYPGAERLELTGNVGDYASTPDSLVISITGDIDFRCNVALNDWTPAANGGIARHWNATGSQRAWDFRVNTAGTLTMVSTADGTTQRVATSTSATGFTDGTAHWLRFTREASTGNVQFYTADDNVNWAQLGSNVSTTAGSIFNSDQPLIMGVSGSGGDFQMIGNMYYSELRDGINGTIVAQFNSNDAVATDTSFISELTGETWTLQGNAVMVGNTNVSDISALGYDHSLINTTELTIVDNVRCFDVSTTGGVNKISSTHTFGNAHTMISWAWALSDATATTWRTLWRTTPNDHPILIQDGTSIAGYYDNDAAGFVGYGANIDALGYEETWTMYSVVGTGGNLTTLYINDNNESGNVAYNATGNDHNEWGEVGQTQPFGYVCVAYLYDKALTSDEIKQVFHATKGRFGL